MKVTLLHSTPLWVCSTAIRKCWASEGKSDTIITEGGMITGDKDKELIDRVGNKFKHSSTLEQLNYSFDIDGISRACLQELVRHRHASLSVKSSRYTLKELKHTDNFTDFLVLTGNEMVDGSNEDALYNVQQMLLRGTSNDVAKYALPEAYKTSLVWTVNARSLQNFLMLRTNKAALKEIQDLAYSIFDKLPEDHKYLFVDSLHKEKE